MRKKNKPALHPVSRREFAGVTLAAATAAVLPADLLGQVAQPAATVPASQTELNPAEQAEAEAMLQDILRVSGSRFSEQEKTDVRRLVTQLERALKKLRSQPLANSVQPATVLRISNRRS